MYFKNMQNFLFITDCFASIVYLAVGKSPLNNCITGKSLTRHFYSF